MRLFAVAVAAVSVLAPSAPGIDEAHTKKAGAIIDKAIAYLRTQQDAATGGWAVNPQGPAYPAITGLVINGMLMQPGVDEKDASVKAGVAYLLKYSQSDGGIYDTILPSYNTAICLSALARVNTPEARAAIKPAQDFLKSLQFGEAAAVSGPAAGETGKVGKDHAFYGGVGYGRSGRPDLSNTAFFIEALRDSGVPADDPAIQRALVFLKRVQMDDRINDMPYAKGSRQGGFIYSTSESKDKVGVGQSEVTTGPVEETMDDGTKVSRLRAYGSMTYSGFKSLIYADLTTADSRVAAALGWIARNYTLQENPGIGNDGLYYYLLTFSRALDANGRLATNKGAAPDHAMRILYVPQPELTVVVSPVSEYKDASFIQMLAFQFGTIRSVSIVHAKGVGRFRGKCFVEFGSADEACKAAADLNKTKLNGTTISASILSADDAAAMKGELEGASRAPNAPRVEIPTLERDWANDLIDRLGELQDEDGSFKSVGKRWLEDNPVLITAYSLLSLQHAVR